MLQNQKGQALVSVMLIALVFTVLGLTIVASTLEGLRRTELRVDDVELTAESAKTLNEVIAQFRNEVSDPARFKLTNVNNLKFINQNLNNLIQRLEEEATNEDKSNLLTIKDLSSLYNIEVDKYLTRAFEFSYTVKEDNRSKTASKKVFLSPTPSFLNYAAGTGPDGSMYLNGASEFNGNIYTNSLYTIDKAKYYDESSKGTAKEANTRLPMLNGKALIRSTINGTDNLSDYTLLKGFFEENSKALFQRDTELYIPLNFNSSIAQVLNSITGSSVYNEEIIKQANSLNKALSEMLQIDEETGKIPASYKIINEGLNNLTDINSINNGFDRNVIYTDLKLINKKIFAENITALPLTILTDFELAKDKWMIVNGDLKISATSNRPVKISGNILVTGDLIIQGDQTDSSKKKNETIEDDEILVDSTMYVLGNTSISNTNIKGLQDKQLVAMTQGQLTVSRINEFKSHTEVEPLDAFLYTGKEAELYGVGSIFPINGGIFAKDKLTINAIRQNTIARSTTLAPNILNSEIQKSQTSRFQVTHDPTVLVDQMNALPRVDQYQVIMDDTLISR